MHCTVPRLFVSSFLFSTPFADNVKFLDRNDPNDSPKHYDACAM